MENDAAAYIKTIARKEGGRNTQVGKKRQ